METQYSFGKGDASCQHIIFYTHLQVMLFMPVVPDTAYWRGMEDISVNSKTV